MQYITPYSPVWPDCFRELARHLRPFILNRCAIHHVGSKSIPGMPAKDIIDAIIECPIGSMPRIIKALAGAGYEHEGDLGVTSREAFRLLAGTSVAGSPTHHLYACESNSPEMMKMLAFRDYLRTHTDRAQWLASKKIECDAAATSHDDYIKRKDPYYRIIIREATAQATGNRH